MDMKGYGHLGLI